MNAARYNRRTQLNPGWTLDQVWQATGVTLTGPEDIHGIREAQRRLAVTDDGLFGPGSIAALHRKLGYAWTYEGLPRLGKAPGEVTCLVVHHSVTRTHAGMIRALASKGASTHFSIEPDGTLHRLCDPDRMTGHAAEWNRCSVGIDLINPYAPKLWREGEPWAKPAPTNGKWGERYGLLRRRSVIPDTPAALATLRGLLVELTERYSLAMTWPELGARLDLNPRGPAQPYGVLPHGALSGNRWDGWGALMGLESGRAL